MTQTRFYTADSLAALEASHSEMLALMAEINYAFYVKGTTKALAPLIQQTKAVLATARAVRP